jgi:hypothetical protein
MATPGRAGGQSHEDNGSNQHLKIPPAQIHSIASLSLSLSLPLSLSLSLYLSFPFPSSFSLFFLVFSLFHFILKAFCFPSQETM